MMAKMREKSWLRASIFSWFLLYIWLFYSAGMLWKLHIDSGGVSICRVSR